MPETARAGEMSASLRRSSAAFLAVAGMSGLVNLLTLTGSFFMLEVYDRVIPSRSMPTLVEVARWPRTFAVKEWRT